MRRRDFISVIAGAATWPLGARAERAGKGGLISYGPDVFDMWRRAFELIDKILRGTKPADIPFEQPTKFDLVVNLKTARALGLTYLRPSSQGLTR